MLGNRQKSSRLPIPINRKLPPKIAKSSVSSVESKDVQIRSRKDIAKRLNDYLKDYEETLKFIILHLLVDSALLSSFLLPNRCVGSLGVSQRASHSKVSI